MRDVANITHEEDDDDIIFFLYVSFRVVRKGMRCKRTPGCEGGGRGGIAGNGGVPPPPPTFVAEMGTEVHSFFITMAEAASSGSIAYQSVLPAAGEILWTGWVTCAYTIYAQSYGQRRVGPTSANLIYTAQPIFSAIFAWALLGETLGPAGYGGGALIAVALTLIASEIAR